MATQETREEQIRKKEKDKAILKAENEMMELAKRMVDEEYSRYGDEMSATRDKIIRQIDDAKEMNYEQAEKQYQTSREELEKVKYNEVDGYHKRKYEEQLKKRRLTDEQVRDKKHFGGKESMDTVAVASSNSKKKKEGIIDKVFSFSKKKEEPGEEEYVKIDQQKRKIIGDGYMDDDLELTKTPKEILSEIADTQAKEEKTVQQSKPVAENLDDVGKAEEKKENQLQKTISKLAHKHDGEYVFDMKDIPDYVQYDIIPLPSGGECYPHKKGRIPVRYLTASDENLIASPNMYTNGQLVDTIVRRCVLDKSFDTYEMCAGDRDAVVLWLRATGYGPEYPVNVTSPDTGKTYKTVINLSEFKYVDFDLKGDENGWFDYTMPNGTLIKFKYMSKKDIDEVFDETIGKFVSNAKIKLLNDINSAEKNVMTIESDTNTHDEALADAIEYIRNWVGNTTMDKDTTEMYSKAVTENMIKYTMSVNGNTDKQYIRSFIENLRAADAKEYRDYVASNKPGVDLSMTIPIPESDGGGSFDTFLTYGETVFINV